MSDPINEPPVSGIDIAARARLGQDSRPDTTDARVWFASESIAPGTIVLPSTPSGAGSQNLDHLVDGILASIDG